ncbi:hypothetical protein L0F63_006875 [Massospora cicadina]|nr:hypothetical protein L0F63_006875 [Massospora cicadina]
MNYYPTFDTVDISQLYFECIPLYNLCSTPTSPVKEDYQLKPSTEGDKREVVLGYPVVITEGAYRPRVKPTILTSGSPLRCSTCQQPFERGSSLRRHEKLHTGIKPFKCQPCNKSFTRLDILRRHQSSTRCRLISQKYQPNNAPLNPPCNH